MRVYSLHLRQRLGTVAQAIHFVVASNRPAQWTTHFSWVPQYWLSAGLLIAPKSLHCEISVVSSISATQLATNTCCLRWKMCIHCYTVVESDQNCNYLSSFHVPWLFVPSNSLALLPLAIPIVVLKAASLMPLCTFQWQMASPLIIFLIWS